MEFYLEPIFLLPIKLMNFLKEFEVVGDEFGVWQMVLRVLTPYKTIQVKNWLEDFIFNTFLVIMTQNQILVNQIECSEITCVGISIELKFYSK